MQKNVNVYRVYTDGSALQSKPWAGAWAGITYGPNGRPKALGGVSAPVTSIEAEFQAVIHCLEALPPGSRVKVFTDCAQVVGAINIINKKSGKKGKLRTRKRIERRQPALAGLLRKYKVTAQWVPGKGKLRVRQQIYAHCYARYLLARSLAGSAFHKRMVKRSNEAKILDEFLPERVPL